LYVDLILLNDDLFSFCVDPILLYIDLILTSLYPFRPIYWKDIHAKEDEAGLLKKDFFMEGLWIHYREHPGLIGALPGFGNGKRF